MDAKQAQGAVEKHMKEFGHLEILVNNVGAKGGDGET